MDYQYSIISPCYCEVKKNDNYLLVKVDNKDNTLTGHIIEKRYELDENKNEHIKKINHCLNCH